MLDSGILHTLGQFKRFHSSEVTAEQFSQRILKCNQCPRRADLNCTAFEMPCADYAKPQNNACPVWNGESAPPAKPNSATRRDGLSQVDDPGASSSNHTTQGKRPSDRDSGPLSMKSRSQVNQLAIISTYFNALDDPRLAENARLFRKKLGQPVTFCEISFSGEYLFSDSYKIPADESARYIWQKERLLNIAISRLPEAVDAVMVIDADLIFRDPCWYENTLIVLQNADIVQPFAEVEYLDQNGNVQKFYPSFANSSSSRPGMPGGAVAFRRSLLDSQGFHEENILGGGDSVMMKRWHSQGLKIDCTPGTARHLYHGDIGDRQHLERYEILKRVGFKFQEHILDNPGGPLKWSFCPGVSQVKQAAADFFINRRSQVKSQVKSQVACDVFIPYHSNLCYLPASIDSVLWQKDVKTIIHLVNDCSEEDDSFIKEQYGALPNIRWYRTKYNAGPYKILNALHAKAETDFIALMDSDDISLPSRLIDSIQTMEKEQTDAFFAVMENFLQPGVEHSQESLDYYAAKPYYKSTRDSHLCNGTLVIRKSAFERANGYENVFCGGDTEFTNRMKRFIKHSLSDQVVALRRLHGKNLSLRKGAYGKLSPERKKIAAEWQKRFALWQTEFNPDLYGGLSTVDDLLEPCIGPGTKIWKGAQVDHQATIGADCVIGQRVELGSSVVIGDRVRIQSGTFIPDGVTIGDDVFIGPNTTFTNDKYPPSRGKHWKPITVERGASIGAACVILPGVRIGSSARIGAGSVVTRDVARNSQGWGNCFQEKSRDKVIVGMATFPPRFDSLIDSIESLHDQVDEIHLCLNQYNYVPDRLRDFPKVKPKIPLRDLSDLGKFLNLSEVHGYYFACDDDLIYPPDYIEKTIVELNKHGGAVSYHGRILPTDRPSRNYYRDVEAYFPCLDDVQEDHQAHVLGTGVLCFHTDQIDFDYTEQTAGGMADIHFAIYAESRSIKLTVLKHQKGWIKHSDKIDMSDTIFARSKNSPDNYTNAINQIEWRPICDTQS